jgi:hypothetical protein
MVVVSTPGAVNPAPTNPEEEFPEESAKLLLAEGLGGLYLCGAVGWHGVGGDAD